MPFTRTPACSCADCVQCCHDQPGPCAPGDVERIAEYLGVPVRVAALKFWASPGALVVDRTSGRRFRIGTITPRRVRGQCIFLKDDHCTIHEVAPAGCTHFDTHMDAAEGQARGAWLAALQTAPAYQSLRRTLIEAGSYRPRSY